MSNQQIPLNDLLTEILKGSRGKKGEAEKIIAEAVFNATLNLPGFRASPIYAAIGVAQALSNDELEQKAAACEAGTSSYPPLLCQCILIVRHQRTGRFVEAFTLLIGTIQE